MTAAQLMPQFLKPLFSPPYTDTDYGVLGSVATIFSMVGTLIGGLLLDHTRRYKTGNVGLAAAASLLALPLPLVFSYADRLPHTLTHVYVLFCAYSCAVSGLFASTFEVSVRRYYPLVPSVLFAFLTSLHP